MLDYNINLGITTNHHSYKEYAQATILQYDVWLFGRHEQENLTFPARRVHHVLQQRLRTIHPR